MRKKIKITLDTLVYHIENEDNQTSWTFIEPDRVHERLLRAITLSAWVKEFKDEEWIYHEAMFLLEEMVKLTK